MQHASVAGCGHKLIWSIRFDLSWKLCLQILSGFFSLEADLGFQHVCVILWSIKHTVQCSLSQIGACTHKIGYIVLLHLSTQVILLTLYIKNQRWKLNSKKLNFWMYYCWRYKLSNTLQENILKSYEHNEIKAKNKSGIWFDIGFDMGKHRKLLIVTIALRSCPSSKLVLGQLVLDW